MLLLTFEGIDGSGKSTQARRLDAHLQKQGYKTELVREPGGTEFAERVRSLLLNSSFNIQAFAELLLFSSARAQLVADRIRPALEADRIVICDRFYDSTTAYQGAGRGVAEPEWLQSFHQRVTGDLQPDRTYLLDIDVETARQRQAEGSDRMESEGMDFYERVASGYADIAAQHPDRVVQLDGGRSVKAVHNSVWRDVQALLEGGPGTPDSGAGSSDPTGV